MAVPYGRTPLGNYSSGGRVVPGYTGLNFGAAYGESPYLAARNRLRGILGDIPWKRLYGTGAGSLWNWGTHVARPGDPEVQEYMANVLGGQRNEMDEYVRRAAGAGIRRGGVNVAGGPAYDAALHQDAMRQLAGGYESRFKQAMDYNKYVKAQQLAALQNAQQAANQLLGLEHQYATSQASWQQRLGDAMRQAYQADIDWDRGRTRRRLQEQLALDQYNERMQRLRDLNEHIAASMIPNDPWPWMKLNNRLALQRQYQGLIG